MANQFISADVFYVDEKYDPTSKIWLGQGTGKIKAKFKPNSSAKLPSLLRTNVLVFLLILINQIGYVCGDPIAINCDTDAPFIWSNFQSSCFGECKKYADRGDR